MAIVRWIPRRSLFDYNNDVNRLWNDFLPVQNENREPMWQPRVDVNEKKDEFNVIVEVPGLTDKDIKISLKEDHLVISGEKKTEEQQEEDNYHCCERHYGKFERTFVLPAEVVANKIDAKVKDGLLTIKLPKAEKVKPKEIAIKVA